MHLPSDNLQITNLIAVYCNQNNTEKFLVGEIQDLNSEYLLLSLISPDASADGLCLCSANAIYRIELDSQYLRRLGRHTSLTTNQHSGNDPWEEFWTFTERKKLLTKITGFSGKQIICGIPVSHTKETVLIQKVHPNTTEGKHFNIRRKKVALAACESTYQCEKASGKR